MQAFRGGLLAASVTALLFTSAGATAAPPDPFVGVWTSVDAVDGSDQIVAFGGSGDTRRITLRDTDATEACATGGPAVVRGTGTVVGDTLSGDLLVHCADGSPSFTVEVTFTHSAGTLDDGFGTTWHRP